MEKWRWIGLLVLVLVVMTILVVATIKNHQLETKSTLSDKPLSSFEELSALAPIEPAPKLAPVVSKTDRSELDAKLEAAGFRPSSELHTLSVRQSGASTPTNN